MATDMQPFLSAVSSAAKHTPSETRERNESRPPSSFADRINNVLGRAEPRRESGPPSIVARPKHAARPHTSTHSTPNPSTNSQPDKVMGSAANTRQEEISNKSDSNQTQEEDSDNGQDEQTAKVHKKATQQTTLSPEELLAAGMATQVQMEEPSAGQTPSPSEGTGKSADAPVGKVSSAAATDFPSVNTQSDALTKSVPALTPGQRPGQLPTDATASGEANHSAGATKSSERLSPETEKGDAGQLIQAQNQNTSHETPTTLNRVPSRKAK